MNLNPLKSIFQSDGYKNGQPIRICPKCGQKKLASEFGWRKMTKEKGPIRNQSWCKKCR